MSALLGDRIKQPVVIAVVVSFNGKQWLESCLRHLLCSTLKPRIVVVDNASTDGSVIACQAFGGVEVICNDRNLGFGRANNMGIAHALAQGADQVLLVNQDAFVQPDMVQRLASSLSAAPSVGIAAPVQWNEDGSNLDPTCLRHYLAESAASFLSDAVLARLKPTYAVASLPAAVWLCSRSLLEQVGGFDPIFFMYCEDDDLCRRARRHGFDVVLVAEAHFMHARGNHALASNAPWGSRVRRKRIRFTSKFLLVALDPSGRAPVQIWRAGVSGLAHAIVEFLNHGDTATLCAGILGVCSGLLRWRTVARHRLLVDKPGTHWL